LVIKLKVTAELQTANVAYFKRKIQLSGFSVYPDDSPSKLVRMSEVLLYFMIAWWWPVVAETCSYCLT